LEVKDEEEVKESKPRTKLVKENVFEME